MWFGLGDGFGGCGWGGVYFFVRIAEDEGVSDPHGAGGYSFREAGFL